MPLTAAYYHCRASEAKDAARKSPDTKLSQLFLEIAQSYEALAENEEWLAFVPKVEPFEFVAEPGDGLFFHHLVGHNGNRNAATNRSPMSQTP